MRTLYTIVALALSGLIAACSPAAADPWTPLPAATSEPTPTPWTSDPSSIWYVPPSGVQGALTPLPPATPMPDLPSLFVHFGDTRVMGNRRVQCRYFPKQESGVYMGNVCATLAPWEGFDAARAVSVFGGESIAFQVTEGYSTSTLSGWISRVSQSSPWLDTDIKFIEFGSGGPLEVDLYPGVYSLTVRGEWLMVSALYDFKLEVKYRDRPQVIIGPIPSGGVAPPPPLPRFEIRYGDVVDGGRAGSHCWPIGQGVRRRGDVIRWPDFANATPVIVKRGGEVVIEAVSELPVTNISGGVYTVAQATPLMTGQAVITPDLMKPFNVDLPPGVYVLEFLAKFSVGDIAYQFKIEVVDNAAEIP